MRIKQSLYALAAALSIGSVAHAGIVVSSPTIVGVTPVSMDVMWVSTTGATGGYVVEAATRTPIPPPMNAISTANSGVNSLTLTGLFPNTTYYVRVGGISAGTTNYANTTPSVKATLSPLLSGTFISHVTSTTLRANWTPLTSTQTVGYQVIAATSASFLGTISTMSVQGFSATSGTLAGLSPDTTYYVKVGALNWGGAPNFSTIGSTLTVSPGANTPPNSPVLVSVFISSLTATWGSVGATNGYVLEASTSSNFIGPITISSTTNGTAISLDVTGLSPNTSYYIRVGALWSGATSYALTSPSAGVTLSAPLTFGTISQVGATTIQAHWAPATVGSAAGYAMEVSTSSTFNPPIYSSMSAGLLLSTLTVSGLAPGTVHYVRIASINDEFKKTYAMIGTTLTLTASVPTNLTGTATGVSNLTWNWNLVSGATGYTIYEATNPSKAVGSVTNPPWVENSLQSNVAYGRVVVSWNSGVASGLSNSATAYTLTNLPTVPNVSSIGSSSFTLTWAGSDPSYTPYQVEIALDSGFIVGFSTPIPFTANLTAHTTTLMALTPATSYWVRLRSRNGDGIESNAGPSTQIATQSGGTVSGGQGFAGVTPAIIQEGSSIQIATISFIVPTGGFTSGGGVKVQLPFGWWPYPQTSDSSQNGYVTALSNPSKSLSVTPGGSDASVLVQLANGQTLTAGSTIQVIFQNISANCPPPNQSTAVWSVWSQPSGSASLLPLSTQPTQSFIAGAAKWLFFNPSNFLTTVANQPSTALVLEGHSFCGNVAAVSTSVVVNLSGYLSDYATIDSGAQFATTSNFLTPITSVVLSSGTKQAVFYYQTSTVGNNLSIRAAYNDLQNGYPIYQTRPVSVLAGGITFSNLSIDNGIPGAIQTSYTLTPDNDGINDFAYIRFMPSDLTSNWRVAISSDGFNTLVYERFGSGDPTGTVQWDGRKMFGGANAANSMVPNGTYTVKVEIPGLTPNTSLSITVSGASIVGSVAMGGTGIANAWVNAQATTGFGNSGAMTDANGNFSINGLKNGQAYNLNTYFYDPNTQTPFQGSRLAVVAPATNADITFSQPAVLRVAATLNQPALQNYFGRITAQDSSFTRFYSGNIHLAVSSSTSDNGDFYNPSTWTVLVVQPGTYAVRLEMPGFPPTQQSVTVGAGQTLDVPLFNLSVPSAVYGLLTLPGAVTQGTWISIDGVKSGNQFPTVWGGVFFNIGQSSGVYQIFNINPGAYTFRVRAPGFAPVSISTTVAGSIGDPTNGGLDIPSSSFGTGGHIGGTLTVNGDTSALPLLTLWVNAYSPALGSGESTSITLTTQAAPTSGSYQINGLSDGTYQIYPPYLSGFDLNPPGPKSVTVSGGVGTLNLTLEENTGLLTGALALPTPNVDYGAVTLSIQGPTGATSIVGSGPTYTIPKLASGFYTLTAFYQTTGAQKQQSVTIVNGRTTIVDLDLDIPTYAVSGTVSIQSAITLNAAGGTSVTINTLADLLANESYQDIYLGGSLHQLSTARVEAFPKRFDSFNNANRNGFTNTFSLSDYKYGLIQADGSYTIPGLTEGVWEVHVYPYLDGGTSPSLAVAKQTLTISNAAKTGIDFALSSGHNVSGTIQLPAGLLDNLNFDVRILTDRGDYVQSSQLALGAVGSQANSTSYLFKNLPSGQYVMVVSDPGNFDAGLQRFVRKYVAKPVAFKIAGADVSSLDIAMVRASRMIGKVSILGKNADGTPSSTLITANNLELLPSNLRIAAQAVPWVEGGYQEADRNFMGATPGGLDLDPNGQFHIEGLVPGTYDVQFRQDSFGAAIIGQGSVNLAAYTKGQVRLTEGQALDLGIIELKQGISLSGTITDDQGNALPNIRVRAQAAGRHENFDNSESFTDAAGHYTLTGLNSDLKTYNIIAAPRPFPGDNLPSSPYGELTKRAIDITQAPLPAVDFVLSAANASLSGTVITEDSGALSYPDGNQQGFPVAAVYMQRQGVAASADNPLGEIQEATQLDGTFAITHLIPGTYQVLVVSLNYKPQKFTLVINAGSNSAGIVTLKKGSALTATLAKPDGSGVNTDDVHFAVAVTADLGSIIFGQITSDDNTRTIQSIRFSGFETNKRYSVLLFDTRDNINSPSEGRNVLFTTDTDQQTLSLTYQASAPTAFAQVKKVGSAVEVALFFSRSLRNTQPSDDIASGLLLATFPARISDAEIASDRRSMTFLYTPVADEQTATIQLSAFTTDIDPTTATEFPLTKSLTLRFGHKAFAEKNVNPVFGGEVSLAETDNDPSRVNVPSNALRTSTGSVADANTTYAISFTATDDLTTATAAPGFRAQAFDNQLKRGAAAYVSEAYAAMQAARASSAVNPFSSFYSVLLPAGLSHTLNQSAQLTLHYDTLADPTKINVYFFDGANYLLEGNAKIIDTVNHTITVNVSHFSTFVVLENSSPVVIVDGATSANAGIEVFNFPNPFNLQTKTLTLSDKGNNASLPTDGTIIRYTIPAAKAGPAHIDIYNVVGEKVRGIDLGTPATDVYHYATWDGKNDSGNKVASGVYIGILKVGGDKKIWKMAVIK